MLEAEPANSPMIFIPSDKENTRNKMKPLIFSIALSTSLFTLGTISMAEEGVRGDFKVISIRNASDVAGQPPGLGDSWDNIGNTVSFGTSLTWIDGTQCEYWALENADADVVFKDDPNLSDLQVPPLDAPHSAGDQRENRHYHILCGGQLLGSLLKVDDRTLVIPHPSGITNIILERPLTTSQTKAFQAELNSMKFYDGEPNGVLDEKTHRAAAFYAEYRGAEFAFKVAAITENLLDGLYAFVPTEENAYRKSALWGTFDWVLDENGLYVTTPTRDVDGDGIADTLKLERSTGTGSSITLATLNLSKNGRVIEVSIMTSFYGMINYQTVPAELIEPGMEEARTFIEEALFPGTRTSEDPSLKTLIGGHKHAIWYEGPPQLPEDDYAILKYGIAGPSWLEYLGGYHRYFDINAAPDSNLTETLDENELHALLGTKHGVILYDKAANRHKWIYVFRGGIKLQFGSIIEATFDPMQNIRILVTGSCGPAIDCSPVTIDIPLDEVL